jgi:hypothetical protein
VVVRGPLFDGHPYEVVQAGLEGVSAAVAKQGAAIIKSKAKKFNVSGRGGTGAAANAVTVRTASTTSLVEGQSARGLVWWPWLEGTSKRNTGNRFRGYHAFRLATNIMRKRARTTAAKAMTEVTAKLGGA